MTGTIDHSHNTITLPNATPAFQGWSVGKFTYTGATGAIQGVFVSDLLGGANPSPGYYFATPETGITGSYAGSEYYATVTGTGGTPPTYTLDGNLYTLGAPTGGAPLSGMWTLTDGSGSSTYDPVGATTLTGSVDATLNSTGDVVASTSYTQTYSPSDDLWHLSADLSPATLSISGTPHSGVLYAAGNAPFTPDIEPPGPPGPCIVNADVTGHFGILTTDGSNLFVYATASGSASYTGTWDFGTSTHYINDLSASGDYTGAARGLAIAPQIENVTPGSGTVTLSDGGETVAELDYTTTDSGSIIVAQYDSNPGGAVPATPLGKYIEIDANIIPPEFTWPVELRVYYSDAEVAAAGIEESTLRMYGWNGSSWVQDESGVNTDANYVWARLYHFSPHGPFGSGGATSAPVFPNVWAGIAAAFGLVVAAYVTRRKLTYQQ